MTELRTKGVSLRSFLATLDRLHGRAAVERTRELLLSPETLLKQSPRVWRTYWDGGELIIDETKPGRAVAHCARCFGFNRNLWLNAIGGVQSSLELAGALDVELCVVSGGDDGDSAMAWETTWR